MIWFAFIFCLYIIAGIKADICENKHLEDDECPSSSVTCLPGHWPSSYCRLTNVLFKPGEKLIQVVVNLTDLEQNIKTWDVWQVQPITSEEALKVECHQVFLTGHFFTMYYYHGSNYFHVHHDTVLPLFVALYLSEINHNSVAEIALFPSVELERAQGLDWETLAFFDYSTYWMQLLKMLSGPHRLLPLDQRLAAVNKTICFEETFFGTPQVKFSDPNVIAPYISYVRKKLGIRINKEVGLRKKVGLIHREGRQKILNEDELLKWLEPLAEVTLVDFQGLTFEEQVWRVQEFDVLAGLNGAGLTNALYLQPHAVTVQLVPYKAKLNVAELAAMLKARGPYLEWINHHEDLNFPSGGEVSKGEDTLWSRSADTYIVPQEFVNVISQALNLIQDIHPIVTDL